MNDREASSAVTLEAATPADADVLDVEEFFVLRQYRRDGVGRAAAFHLWDRLPGRWTVRVSEGVRGALQFWTAIVTEYTDGRFTQFTLPGDPNPWRVLSFESR